MKKTLFFVLIVITALIFTSCILKKPLPILEVSSLEDKEVHFNLSFDNLKLILPKEVEVILSGGKKEKLNVNWIKGNYDETVPTSYTIYGDIVLNKNVVNPEGFKAEINIIVNETVVNNFFEPLFPESIFLTDSTVNTLYITIDTENLNELYSRDVASDERLFASAKFNLADEDIDIEIRFRGGSTRYFPKKSFNIRFDEKQDILFGSDRMNLNAYYSDGTIMKEKIVNEMFHYLNQPAPRTVYFETYINEEFAGLYLHIERIDSDFLKYNELHAVSKEYTLVRDEFRHNKSVTNRNSAMGFDIDSVDNPEEFVSLYFDSRSTPNWSEVVDLIRWVYNTPAGSSYASGFKQRIDIDNFMDWLAIHFIVMDLDAYADDYWLYKNHSDPNSKWMFIPWDKDLTFGSIWRDLGTLEKELCNDYFFYEYELKSTPVWQNDLITKFLATEELRNMLYERMEELINEHFTYKYFYEHTQNISNSIKSYVQKDIDFTRHKNNNYTDTDNYDYYVELLSDFNYLRNNYIRTVIGEFNNTSLENYIDDYYKILFHPAPDDQEIYTASIFINKEVEDRTMYFVDNSGWTIARLDLDKVNQHGEITITVQKNNSYDVDRVWNIKPNGADFEGILSIFYRNDTSGKNWVLPDQDVFPLENDAYSQWDLILKDKTTNSQIENYYINPFSNKISTEIHLSNEISFIVTF